MNPKYTQSIRVEILPRLESLANKLWDDGLSPSAGRQLDYLISELESILDEIDEIDKIDSTRPNDGG